VQEHADGGVGTAEAAGVRGAAGRRGRARRARALHPAPAAARRARLAPRHRHAGVPDIGLSALVVKVQCSLHQHIIRLLMFPLLAHMRLMVYTKGEQGISHNASPVCIGGWVVITVRGGKDRQPT
jgi:hypothetical protein